VVDHLRGERCLSRTAVDVEDVLSRPGPSDVDLSEVRGHAGVKRALEIAAAGGHNALLAGPPGSGKTMLARRLPGILPPLTREESLEVTAVHSVAGLLPPNEALVTRRPFRAPHQTISAAGLIGGGSPLRPGEVSLAHRGVLFLDEIAEYPRHVLETLRQPMEDGSVTLVRAKERVRLPARFVLVAAMNPCPCGHLGDSRRACICEPVHVTRYRSRISGPLRDRIDLHLTVGVVPFRELHDAASSEPSARVRERVVQARCRQAARTARAGLSAIWNSGLGQREIQRWCRPTPEGRLLLEDASDRMSLSSRGVHRVLKVARTIADLEGREGVEEHHLAEALQYRPAEA
jgi:magnesium chelatase family protein